MQIDLRADWLGTLAYNGRGINRFLENTHLTESSTCDIKVAGFSGTRLFAVGRPFEGMVMAKSQSHGDFRILSRLSPDCLESFRRHLRPVELEVKQDIYQPNRPIADVYFVEKGMISVVSTMESGRSIEVGTIGKEGVAGAVVLLGAKAVSGVSTGDVVIGKRSKPRLIPPPRM